jgi:small-conductance mechanosensitive channel
MARGVSRLMTAAVSAALSVSAVVPVTAQTSQITPPPAAQTDPEAVPEPLVPAAVLLGGETVVWVPNGSGPYTAQFRAGRITQRLEEAVHDLTVRAATVTVTEVDGSSELRFGPRLLMVVTQKDAASFGVGRAAMANQYARDLTAAIHAERLRYEPGTLVRSGIYGAFATVVLGLLLWIIGWFGRWLGVHIGHLRERRLKPLRVQQAELVSADSIRNVLDVTVRAIRVVLIVAAFDLYLTFVLGLFPWTRAVSFKLLDYAVMPLRAAAAAFVGYLPNMLFVVVIATIIYATMRLVGLFFDQVRLRRVVFKSFPEEWAAPTNSIVRVLLIAFGVVVAFPYLPASDSPAFTGVSVFIGVLLSLASSSSLSNMIAGLVLTYTRAFRLGDRVKVGDAFGDILETSLLATHIQTIKNEVIVVPNGLVLSGSVTNYSRAARTQGLILHTSVTIGYDAPWRTIHGLLIEAARATPGVLQEPAPFVWQTALNDFYVTYEINAYTDAPREMPEIYAALHARIQDAFYAAGVEIMSPHFTAIRDGNAAAIPDAYRVPGYGAPAFRVAAVPPRVDGA